jgi:predicted dehydrogenase
MSTRIAFIGAGGIAGTHMDNIEERDDAEVVAICDVVEEVAEEAADRFDAAAYTDHHDLYEEEAFDAVIVAIPPFAHEDQEVLAAEHGVDLLVEKPLALSEATAETIAEAVEDSDVVTQVGHMNRYSDMVERADELLGDREIALVDARWIGGVPGGEDHWWRKRERSGGQIIEQATHVYDLVRYFAGEVDSVAGYGGQQVRTDLLDFPDAATVSMRHEDGAVSHVFSSSASPDHEVSVELVGDDAQLTIDFTEGRLTGHVDGEEIDYETDGITYADELDAFLEAVETRDGSLCRSPYHDALETFRVTLAATEAADEGGEVDV